MVYLSKAAEWSKKQDHLSHHERGVQFFAGILKLVR